MVCPKIDIGHCIMVVYSVTLIEIRQYKSGQSAIKCTFLYGLQTTVYPEVPVLSDHLSGSVIIC